MLSYLHVKNLALIDEAEVEFGPGLNILTGETGAGKSILMGSVNLALGQKVSRDMIRDPQQPALVELIFLVENPACAHALSERGISLEEDQVILSRKITHNRSISRINGEVCTAAQIREISSLLLDIHGQHEHQSLLYQDHQLAILDAYGGERTAEEAAQVEACYRQWSARKKELAKYQMDEEARRRELSFLEYEIQEIEEAELLPGEDEELEKQYRAASNSKQILEGLGAVGQYLDSGTGAGDLVSRALLRMNKIQEWDERLPQITQMLSDVESLLGDLGREIDDCIENLTFSDEEFYQMDQRLNLLNHLKSKYGATTAAILEELDKKRQELDRLRHYEEYKAELERQLREEEDRLLAASDRLHELRAACAEEFARAVREGLKDLNFAGVLFEIYFENQNHFGPNGYDKIEFQISANPGEPLRPLAKVASGGELSRIMLAIKTILADRDQTETLIFDEIDTGISGRTAQKVSEKMALIGRTHQVLCITHLPQIAAMADHHFEILKKVENGETTTRIRPLDEETSVCEIARILGGAEITEHTLASAREMKELAWKQKNRSVK